MSRQEELMNLYRIIEEQPVREQEILKSPHFVKIVIDPTRGEEKLYASTGSQISTEDLIHATALAVASIYRGLQNVEEYADKAEIYKRSIMYLVSSGKLWEKEDSSDKN